jgi:hypothetical protein
MLRHSGGVLASCHAVRTLSCGARYSGIGCKQIVASLDAFLIDALPWRLRLGPIHSEVDQDRGQQQDEDRQDERRAHRTVSGQWHVSVSLVEKPRQMNGPTWLAPEMSASVDADAEFVEMG